MQGTIHYELIVGLKQVDLQSLFARVSSEAEIPGRLMGLCTALL